MRRKARFRVNRVSRAEQASLQVGALVYPEKLERPKTRGDCKGGIRPCPFVGCRFHLYLEVSHAGSVTVNFDGEVWDMGETCALDVADRGDHMLEEIANVLGCTREAIRLVEAKALVRFLRKATDVPWER
jgi:hypothetical protein